MCDFCEPYFDESLDEMAIRPLPAFPGFEKSGYDMILLKDDGVWQIATVCFPPSISGPVSYCPMCGRKLEGGENGDD